MVLLGSRLVVEAEFSCICTCNDELSQDVISVVVGGPVSSCPPMLNIRALQGNTTLLDQHLTCLHIQTTGIGRGTCRKTIIITIWSILDQIDSLT